MPYPYVCIRRIPLDTFDLMGIAYADDDDGHSNGQGSGQCSDDEDEDDWETQRGRKRKNTAKPSRPAAAHPTAAAAGTTASGGGLTPAAASAGTRARWLQLAREAADRVFSRLPWDAAADQLAARFQKTRLPPVASMAAPAAGGGAAAAVTGESSVRLAFPQAARLVLEGALLLLRSRLFLFLPLSQQ